jgi:photosystem II stability/assembly factor-like uncharacterized protein
MQELIGKTLGGYRIIEQIGLGGMATVYKAYQPSMDRYVALKVLSTHLTQDPTFVKRFQQEAKVIAKLEHLHILPVHDHGEEDGYLYLVMRFIEAGTLKDRLEGGPLSLEETRHIVTQVGSALEYAHQLGVVHRDLKPSNVLIDPQEDCYLTDFGIAKMVEGTLGLTGSAVLGTPHYMAPEQSQSFKVDHRADVYAMGVIIYEMVTGQLPFDADTPFAVVMKHISEPLPLPRSVKHDLPESVERVILKALAKDPVDRYQSMRDLVAAFDQAVAAAPAEVRTSTAPSWAAPMPTVIEEGVEAEPTAVVTRPVAAPTWQQWVKAQPLWIPAAAALALVVLVLAGLILSRVPGRVEISGGQVQVVLPSATGTAAAEVAATPTKTTEAKATATSTLQSAIPTKTPISTQTPRPTPTSAGTPTLILPPTPASPLQAAVAGLRWEQVYDGEMFLRVGLNAVAVDPGDPGTILAGTYGAGIYVSRDGGRTWTPSNAGLGKGTVSRLAIDPNDSDVVYAALFDQGGVYKSTDGGRTWGAASTGIDLDRGWDWVALISIDPSDSQRLYYAGATEGFYLSTNGGQRWMRQSVDCPQVMDFVVDPADFGHIYAANHSYSGPECLSGVYGSTDGGQTWKLLSTAEMVATDEFGSEPWHVAADPRDWGTLYAGNHLSTYQSSDRGRTWTQIRDDGCDWLATNPGDGTLYCGQGGGLQISPDGGRSWSTPDLAGWGRWNSHPFAVAPDDPQTLYTGSDVVMKSGDGGRTWLRVGRLGAARMRLTVDPRDGNRLFLGGVDSPCETYRSENGGETWQVVVTDADGCPVVVDPAQSLVYRPDRGWGLYLSRDNGQTWEQFGSGYRDTWQLVPDPQDSQKLWVTAGCSARPFLSEDGGATFIEVESFPEEICGDPILLAHPDGKRIYVESNGVIYRSDDGGGMWRRLVELGGMYRAAALDPSDPDVAYLGSTHKGVLKTTNGGRTWFEANVGLTASAINQLAVDPGNPQTVYAATDGGAFLSLDAGEGWWPVQEGLGPNPIVYSIAVDPNDSSKVYAVTPDGVFRLAGVPPVAAELAPTPRPSMTDQARVFAEPILAAIADRPPDLEDDFSDPTSGWERGAYVSPDGWEEGERGYVDGEYFIVAPPAKPRPQHTDTPITCASGFLVNRRSFSDMVLEVEGRFVAVEDGNWHINLRQWQDPTTGMGGKYEVMVFPEGTVEIAKVVSDEGRVLMAQLQGPPIRSGLETNRLQIVVVGPQIALYVNGEMALFATDRYFEEQFESEFSLVVCNEADAPLEARWDNLRVWDISDLSPSSAEAVSIATPRTVPAGQCRIAYEEDGDIYVRECDGTGEYRLTDHPAEERYPAWSPDGTRIVFYSNREHMSQPGGEDINDLFLVNADGSGLTPLTSGEGNDMFPDWSPDGGRIAFHGDCGLILIDPKGIYLTPIRARGDAPCVDYPTWSPDGRRLAFTSWQPEPGRTVFVINEDGSGLLELAHFQAGDALAVWSPDGQRLGIEVRVDDGTTQYYLLNADGSGGPVEVPSIPDSWYPWHWPQWGGE